MKRGEVRYRTIFESIQDAVLLMDRDVVVDCNPATLRMFGCSRELIVGRSPASFSPEFQPDGEESSSKAEKKIASALDGCPQCFEWRHCRYDGTAFDAEVRLDRFEENGSPMLLAVVRDISEKKRAHLDLAQAEARYRSLVEQTSDWVWEVDTEGRYTYCSPKVRELLGHDPQEMLGRTPFDFMVPEDVPRVKAAFLECVRRKGRIAIRNTAFRKNGKRVILETSGEPIIEADRLVGFRGIDRDVTERELAAGQLQQANQNLKSILESIDDGFFALNNDLLVTYFNSAAERLLHCKSCDVLGKPFFECFSEAREPIFEEQFCRALKKKVAVTFETHFAGSPYRGWYEVRVYPKQDGISVFFQTITARKLAEEALRMREEQLMMLVKHAPASIAMLDTEMRYLAVSDRFLKDYRLANRDLIGLCHYDVFPEIHHMQKWLEIHKRCLAGAIESCEEDQFPRSDGSVDWVKWEIVPWRNPEGVIGGIVMFTEVVTERKVAQLILQQKNEELSKFFSVTLDLLCIAELDGRFRRLNAAWERTLGYSQEELFVGRFLDLVHPDDIAGTMKAMSVLASEKEVVNFVNRFRCKNGTYRWLEWRSAPAGDLIYAAARDITERREAEEQLKTLNLSLERRIAERTAQLRVLAVRLSQTEHRERRRISNVLHEHFQQLIVGAKMHLSALRDSLASKACIRTCDRVDEILTQAVEASRALATELGPPVLHGLGLVPAIHWLARTIKESYGLDVDVSADPEAEPGSDDARTLLFEIISELLLNIVKHAHVRSASVRVTVDQERQMELLVSDAGVGFNPAGVSALNPDGLGLFSARERIEWLGGTLAIDSVPGGGTRILIRLPLNYPASSGLSGSQLADLAADEITEEHRTRT